MLYKLSLTLSILCFILSILNPSYYPPWSSFISEYLAFLSLLFLLPLFVRNTVSIPKISQFFILLSIIPIFQYSFGQIFYFDKAVLSFIYIISFWLAIIIGFNSVNRYKYSLDYFFLVIMGCGLLSSFIAVAQWLNIGMSIDWVMVAQSRPSANMAQPNHLATFLLLSLISCAYFYQNRRINTIVLVVSSLLLLSAIALTQSRTAWVSLLFIAIYWSVMYRKSLFNFSYKKISLFVSYFIAVAISFPILKEKVFGLASVTIAQRASSGHERIQIWQQAIEAIQHQPLWGYGWNQSSFAQYETLQPGYVTRYLTSFHNIFLDILVWCGIPIGATIIIACVFIVLKLLIKSVTVSQICLITSVCVILIHSLFEFPLSYSYFLLPLGFMLGYLFFTINSHYIQIRGLYFLLIFSLGIGLSLFIAREYSYIPDNMVGAETYEMNEVKGKDTAIFPYHLYFFDTFDSRARWISLYPCTEMKQSEIDNIKNMVKTYMIHYDLYKFSQLLYFNGNKVEAEKHLYMLNYMYKKDFKTNDLQCNDD